MPTTQKTKNKNREKTSQRTPKGCIELARRIAQRKNLDEEIDLFSILIKIRCNHK